MAKGESLKPKPGRNQPDFATLCGLLVGLGGILCGLILDGGKVFELIQLNAALIVFGGTLGAVMVTTPTPVLLRAARHFRSIFFAPASSASHVIEEIIRYAGEARKRGIVSLEEQARAIADPFLRKALMLAIDGIDMDQIRSFMETEIDVMEQEGEAEAKVFESAGGYSPTIGIIGAVLGLMQVMKHLADIDEVGRGIAAAFVATVYGVAAANLFFIPAGQKMRARVRDSARIREIMLEGVLAITEGLNPKLIRMKLEAYEKAPGAKAPAKEKAAPAAAPASSEV